MPLTGAEVAATANTIAAAQDADGRIPWLPGGKADSWNHVEAAMGLDVAGRHREAEAAYRWLAQAQNPDGSWHAGYPPAGPSDLDPDANFTAYLAVGVRHHVLATGNEDFLAALWPTVRTAIGFVLGLRQPSGAVRWRTSKPIALLAGNSSIHASLRSAAWIAEQLRQPRPAWRAAADGIASAITERPREFMPKPHAMDWYYPVLAGVLDAETGNARIDRRWGEFVVPGLGVRCVSDQPWVTGGETAELALTLAAAGRSAEAEAVFATLSRLRHADGSYWTGYQYANRVRWPADRTTWTAGAVLLAHAALSGHPPTLAVFGPS